MARLNRTSEEEIEVSDIPLARHQESVKEHAEFHPDFSEPPVDDALIAFLERTYPDRLPDYIPTPEEIARRIGQQQLIRHLRAINKRQKDQSD